MSKIYRAIEILNNISYQMCVHMDINSNFFHEESICGTRYQASIFLKIPMYTCLTRDATFNFFAGRDHF